METKPRIATIDLHCHSWASNRPTLWLMQRIGCPESFTSPEHIRDIAMQRDMDFVAITDHNTIEGVKEIDHYDNVIRGNEVTTYFPNGVKVHVVVLDITDEQFDRIQEVRQDIYEFVKYINEEDILHFCAHPLHKVNERLKWEHFERLLLLFNRFEVLNGTRLQRQNDAVKRVLSSLTQDEINRLSDKYDIEPVGDRPWEKFIVGGTDDHSGLFVGTCYTEVEVDEMTKEGLLKGIREGKTREVGSNDGSLTLAHQVNSIAFQYYRSKISQESSEALYILNRIFERSKPIPISRRFRIRKTFKRIYNYFRKPKGTKINLVDEIREIVSDHVALKTLFQDGVMTREEYNENVFNLTSDVFDQMVVRVFEKPKLLYYFAMFAPVVLSSYLMVCRNLHTERDLIEQAEDYLGEKRPPKVAWFTDSLVNMDGVSKTCRTFLDAAQRRELDLTMITCHEDDTVELDGIKNFAPIKKIPVPGYEKVPVFIPSILQVLKFVEEQDFDSIIISTPGPVGLMGMLCGRLMHLPLHGIYHTDFPRIALQVTEDPMFGELALQLTRMFYKQVDRVYAPCQYYIDDLENIGVDRSKTDLLERWVDTHFFSPNKREEDFWHDEHEIKLLYVGRISKDKNIDALVEMVEELAPRYANFVLHVVGDGPYFDELEYKTSHLERFILTGAKYNEELATAYASSDLFVYPGLLDTFGNVVIEAQASGLPCVVMNEGGPRELIEEGETGLIAHSTRQFIRHTETFLQNPARMKEMGNNAAAYAAHRFAEDRIFNNFWKTVSCKTTLKPKDKPEFRFHYSQEESAELAASSL